MTFSGNTEKTEQVWYSASKELYIFYADENEKYHLRTGFLTYERKVNEEALDRSL